MSPSEPYVTFMYKSGKIKIRNRKKLLTILSNNNASFIPDLFPFPGISSKFYLILKLFGWVQLGSEIENNRALTMFLDGLCLKPIKESSSVINSIAFRDYLRLPKG